MTGFSLRRRASFALAWTLGLVALADWLFYERPFGMNAALFALALLAAVLLRDGRALRCWPGRVLAMAAGGLVVALAIEPGPLPVVMGLLVLPALAVVDRNGLSSGATVWLVGVARFLGRAAGQPFRDARVQQRWQRSRGVRYPVVRGLLRWVVPFVLSLVFIGLFAAANPIIAEWTAELPELFAPLRLVLWVMIGMASWGLIRARLRIQYLETGLIPPPGSLPMQRLATDAGVSWITRCLLLFNVVFAVQTVLDLVYLYGGASLPDGMTYAEYAHRGAYPLIATALLAGLFVLVTFRPGGAAQRSTLTRRLVYLWVAQNVLLLAGSAWRLSLYVEVYSLTRWRIAAGVWMALIAIALVLLVTRILTHRDNRWLVQANTLTAGLVLYACCFIGFDRIIADYNVRHSREVVSWNAGSGAPQPAEIDLDYLEALGPDALPAIDWLLVHTDRASHEALHHRAEVVRTRLQRRLFSEGGDWRVWTWRRARLAGDVVTIPNAAARDEGVQRVWY